MGQYLIDNNVISYYFSEAYPEEVMNLIATIINEVPNISVITEIEALSWVNPDKKKESVVVEFIAECNILTITPSVVSQCVSIRRQRKIKTPDAVIAATAVVHGLTLITSDEDFNKIPGLSVLDPNKIDL